MNPRKTAIQELKAAGFEYDGEGANHEMYYNKEYRAKIPVSRSSHFDDEDLKMIRREIKRLQQGRQRH